jgi:4-hydroxy-tetrahydrodipicolinate synthase
VAERAGGRGSRGERGHQRGPHLSAEERVRVIEIVSEEVGDRTLIVAGLAGSFTAQAAASPRTQRAPALGLCSSPDPRVPGGRSTQRSRPVTTGPCTRRSGLPLIAFQLQPALGGVNFSATLERLMTVEGVVAIKEASFDAKRFVDTIRTVRGGARRPGSEWQRQLPARGLRARADGALLGFGTPGPARRSRCSRRSARDHARAIELAGVLQPLCDAIRAPVRDYRARIKHALATRRGDRSWLRPSSPAAALPEEASRSSRLAEASLS